MKRTSNAGRVRQALREATMVNHQRVDDLFSDFSLDSPAGYGAFLRAHARALAPLEQLARPDAPRLPRLMEDLASLGEALPEPLAVERQGGEAFRWGALYALEGSRLGGAMLERRVPRAFPVHICHRCMERAAGSPFRRRWMKRLTARGKIGSIARSKVRRQLSPCSRPVPPPSR